MARLRGMKDICKYENRSESTVLALIRQQDYPAVKIKGEWAADTDMIEKWHKGLIEKSLLNNGLDHNDHPGDLSKKAKVSSSLPSDDNEESHIPINPVVGFINECCVIDEKQKVTAANLYKRFKQCWKDNEYGPDCLSEEDFNDMISANYEKKVSAAKPTYVGIGLKI